MDIIPDKRKVVGLVEQAAEGKICLRNFQRDFVWTREEVADLVRSIVRRYFIGSLLSPRVALSSTRPPGCAALHPGEGGAQRNPGEGGAQRNPGCPTGESASPGWRTE